VFTPNLTCIGERSHLLSPQVDLGTHIKDVVDLIRWEDLSDVVLCGHSYGDPHDAVRSLTSECHEEGTSFTRTNRGQYS